ncbi:MAG TPA: hypothetical protein VF069_06580 [Streptosporangiaceae bacterium]
MPAPDLTYLGNALPAEDRLSLYVATRLLGELQSALHLIGLATRYERPGAHGVEQPRLYVLRPTGEGPEEAVRVTTRTTHVPHSESWFEWERENERICRTSDLPTATRLIAERLSFRA